MMGLWDDGLATLRAIIPSSHNLIISIILLLTFFLRVFRLDFQELRGDEAFGYFFSLRTFDDIVQATLDLREPHPVASYFVQHVWLDWVGHSEFALRYLGVLFSVTAVALGYRLALRLGLGRGVALIGAGLMAVSPYAVWHSQDARMYSMSL
ncbi:MAG: glycosyltransferase family 39 protein, partial [Caldilineaceae bacterium]|nr:glycosyltransferase family 39 protein [Caldilineaceae bacterium]